MKNPALTYGAAGIAGLGFSKLSSLLNSTNSSTGQSLLYNLFAANQSTPNFIAFALQRETEPGDDVQGTFSIGMSFYPRVHSQLEMRSQAKWTLHIHKSLEVTTSLRGPFIILIDGTSWSTQLSSTTVTTVSLCRAAWL